jgi:hypothetical protein
MDWKKLTFKILKSKSSTSKRERKRKEEMGIKALKKSKIQFISGLKKNVTSRFKR